MERYIRLNDRVIVVGNTSANGSSDLSAHQGKHGVVIDEVNRDGRCRIRLDDGAEVYAWSGADLELK